MYKLRRASIKNIMSLLHCGRNKAWKELQKIKEKFRVDMVTLSDVANYYKIEEDELAMFI
ncbi:MAG: hypothetical protein CMP48_25175 [Rickettsiales bacterium]|nr:hypothetical protein [Rickettsiales bacterium]